MFLCYHRHMALPTTSTWTIANFDESTIGTLLSLGPSDLTATPGTTPYFTEGGGVLRARSDDGTSASLEFHVGMPGKFTVDLLIHFVKLPLSLGDLYRRVELTLADDASRGVSIYFSKAGMAVSRVDTYDSAALLPGMGSTISETSAYVTIRVAVDSTAGLAYVYGSVGETEHPALRQIVPVEDTPLSVGDLFKLTVRGTVDEPVEVRVRKLRLASGLVVANYPPVADAGPDRVVAKGTAVRFDGRASYDPEGLPVSYKWRLVDAPEGSRYAWTGSTNTTDDGDADGVTNTLKVNPLLVPSWVLPGTVVILRGRRYEVDYYDAMAEEIVLTEDAAPDNLSGEPIRLMRQSFLSGANTESPYGVPDVAGGYRVALVVSDGDTMSDPSEAVVSVTSARLPFGVEPDVAPIWKMLGDEWELVEGREVFEEGWRAASRILGGKLLELWQYHYNLSIQDAQNTLMRKWVPFRTTTYEEDPSRVQRVMRYGAILAEHRFDLSVPSANGTSIKIEVWDGATPWSLSEIEVPLTSNDLTSIVDNCNAVLSDHGIEAYSFGIRREGVGLYADGIGSTVPDGDFDGTTRFLQISAPVPGWVSPGDTLVLESGRHKILSVNNGAGWIQVTSDSIPDNLSSAEFRIYRHLRLGLRSTTRAFRVADSTGATALGLPVGVPNYLEGTDGLRVTGNSYYLGDGLTGDGVVDGDLFVINNGQALTVGSIGSSYLDPLPNQRLILLDDVPDDASSEWSIPSWMEGQQDYAREGVFAGDLVVAEAVKEGATYDLRGMVISVKEGQVAVALDDFFGIDSTYDLWIRGIKRRKAIRIPGDVKGVPQLQDLIPQAAGPTVWKEQVDFYLEPFYRDDGFTPIPMLQFRDSVFIDPDIEPPDILWAEMVVFDNEINVENLFGQLAGFYREDAGRFGKGFNYVSGVAGLMYAQQRGPKLYTMRVGAQILLGQPFAEVAGTVVSIDHTYSPTMGRVLVRDASITEEPSEIVRSYFYRKNPRDFTATSGLDINIRTGLPIAEGDVLDQFAPIGSGVGIVDTYSDPKWLESFIRTGAIHELEKFHSFLVEFDLDLTSLVNMALLYQFIYRVKPVDSAPLLLGMRLHDDDMDLKDELHFDVTLSLIDSFDSGGMAYTYDDYRGDGTTWSTYDDGVTRHDAIIDTLLDEIDIVITMYWTGGPIEHDSALFYDVEVENVDGTTVTYPVGGGHPDPSELGYPSTTPGSKFTPVYDLDLPAGTYRFIYHVKTGGVLS